jgi:hypothetical protein
VGEEDVDKGARAVGVAGLVVMHPLGRNLELYRVIAARVWRGRKK